MKIKTKPTAIKLVAAVLSFLIISSVLPFFAVTASAEGITPTIQTPAVQHLFSVPQAQLTSLEDTQAQ